MFGRTVLATGPETLLLDRAVERWRESVRAEQPEIELGDVEAATLDGQTLAELTGGSLFASHSAVVIRDVANLPPELTDQVVALAKDTPDDVALILTHLGGQKGKGLVDKLKKAKVEIVPAEAIKPYKLPDFVLAEARALGVRLDAGAATALVEGVGQDARALAGALRQLVADAGEERLSVDVVRRYFSGRAEVSSFGVADDVMRGAADQALEKLRWALSTGVSPVLITSALASSLRGLGRYSGVKGTRMSQNEMAAAAGVPPWKLRDLAAQSRNWSDRRIADGIRAVAQADADVKGQAGSPDFVLERLVLQLATRPPQDRR